MYIEIKITDEENVVHIYKANLVLKDYFTNNKLTYNNYKSEKNNNFSNQYKSNSLLDNTNYISLNLPNKNIEEEQTNIEEENIQEKLASIGYEYNNDTKTYFKYDGTKEIEYDVNKKSININEKDSNFNYQTNYQFLTETIYFNVFESLYYKVKYKYFINTDKFICIIGNCNEYKDYVNNILNEYENILTTLQS